METVKLEMTRAEAMLVTVALRDEVKKRTKSIDRAEASQRAGNRVQSGMLDEHYSARDWARQLIRTIDAQLYPPRS